MSNADPTLTINGENFESPVPLANDTPLSIISATKTQLIVTVPVNLLGQPGNVLIQVANVLPSGINLFSNTENLVVTSGTAAPVLTPSKSHAGNFTQGQTGATYTANVANAGSASTDGSTVTLQEIPPSTGLAITSMDGGSTWNCNTTLGICTTNVVLNGGATYPPITVTVNVATNAPSTVTNEISVSGGGSAPSTASDPTTITPATGGAELATNITPSSATFPAGSNQSYTVIISDDGTANTTGPVTVTTSLDSHETLTSANGGSFFNCTTGSSGSPVCTSIGNLAVGGTGQFTVNFALAPGFTGNVTFSLVASAPGASNITAMVTTPVQ